MPQHSAPNRNTQAETNSNSTLPLSGTPKTKTPTNRQISMSIKPTQEVRGQLAQRQLDGRTGVESSCSIVPFSHSRAMVSEVSSAAMIIMITAIRPGTMKFRDTRSVLYQTRISASTAVASRFRRAALCASGRSSRRIGLEPRPRAYPMAMDAVLESLPSSSNLHLRLVARQQIARIVGGITTPSRIAAADPSPARWACRSRLLDDLEIARSAEMPDQVRGSAECLVRIVDDGRDPIDVQAQRVAEQQQHHATAASARAHRLRGSRMMCSNSLRAIGASASEIHARLRFFLLLDHGRRTRLPSTA